MRLFTCRYAFILKLRWPMRALHDGKRTPRHAKVSGLLHGRRRASRTHKSMLM